MTEPKISEECLDKTIPIELSKAGFNAYYHHCDVYQGRSSYAVCQHTIDAVINRKVQLRSECQTAIENGSCPALKMREQEQIAGKALFFEDRRERLKHLEAVRDQGSPVVQYGRRGRAAQPPLETKKVSAEQAEKFTQNLKPRPKSDDPINTEVAGRNLLGEAINNLMKEQK